MHQKEWETCLMWSFLAKMDKWQDVTALSWYQLQLEIKHKKAMLAHLKATKFCDLALPGGTVHSGEGGGAQEDGGFHLEKLPETLPWLNSPGAKVHQVT